ncbi:MAG: hypothetical protein MZV63_63745 [Marinilabiliales bacterium]|nr:hypothetical protein [Marinilabiliales bacterium]
MRSSKGLHGLALSGAAGLGGARQGSSVTTTFPQARSASPRRGTRSRSGRWLPLRLKGGPLADTEHRHMPVPA